MRKLKAYILRTRTKPDGKFDLFGLLAWIMLEVFIFAGIVFILLEASNPNIGPGVWLVGCIWYAIIVLSGLMFLIHRDERIGSKN